jgi:hypothetical protein
LSDKFSHFPEKMDRSAQFRRKTTVSVVVINYIETKLYMYTFNMRFNHDLMVSRHYIIHDYKYEELGWRDESKMGQNFKY